ncbi:TPA: dTMP kinase [Candidatus Gastranaerophilales bacterium HUM_9]|nr:MAG TPA: dTMP kinase [Candidatus Gastranaerophilales bacterium HUM_9]HBX35298.1 dTMP kinase [Cyanobacteria bacterium UBA11440]
MKKGLFITFEGTDGCGKTTQIELLKRYLEEKGYKVVLTREPGAKGLGEKLREILLNYDGDVSSNCESFLFLADRAQHIDMLIKPAIERGEVVLCDRHTDSTVAYQGYGRGLDLNQIKMLNDIATNGVKPDMTFVFDIDIETAQKRVGKTKDRMESAGIEFFKRVRQGYLEIAKSEPERVKVLDATQTIETIANQVKEYIDTKL